MTDMKRGDRIIRDGMILEFIEEEIEGEKFIVVGPAPAPSVGREEIARVIEPSAFEGDRWRSARKQMLAYQEDALKKADAILALLGRGS